MSCIHCGEDVLTMEYTLHCTPETRDARTIELQLCTDCLRTLCAESTIELKEEPPYPTAD